LLDRLPLKSFEQIKQALKIVQLNVGHVLYEPRAEVRHVYFPIDSVVSAVTVMNSGAVIEVATVGREGMTGLEALTPVPFSPHRVFSQIAGSAFRLEGGVFSSLVKADALFWETLARYQAAFLYQVSQSVACNGLHVIRARCCRWLLMTHDRVTRDELALTHEAISFMLGVRRASVTEVLDHLRDLGLIRLGRGKVHIVDRGARKSLLRMLRSCH
jgi:CRP-like cAMP-binding protein